MPRVSEALEESAFSRQVFADRLTARQQRDSAAELAALTALLVAKLRQIALSEPSTQARQFQRLERLLRNMSTEIQKVYQRLRAMNRKFLADLAQNEDEHVRESVAAAAGAGLLWRTLTDKAARELVAGMDIEGQPLREWWSRQRADVLRDFRRQMRQGIIAGEDTETMVNRVRGTSAQRGRGGLMGTARRHVETLVKTSAHSARQGARMETFKRHQEVVTHVQAMNEDPVSAICQSRAGQVWPVDQAPPHPPWHPNCKTTYIPIFRKFSDLEKQDIPQRLQNELEALSQEKKAGLDGKPAAGLTPKEIFSNMPEERARELLGKNRFEMFQKGQLNFSQLIDQSGRPTRLEDLKK